MKCVSFWLFCLILAAVSHCAVLLLFFFICTWNGEQEHLQLLGKWTEVDESESIPRALSTNESEAVPAAFSIKRLWDGPLFIWFEQEVCVNAIANCTQESPPVLLRCAWSSLGPLAGGDSSSRSLLSRAQGRAHPRVQMALDGTCTTAALELVSCFA